MVKLGDTSQVNYTRFESDVIPDSGKTSEIAVIEKILFESDVIPDSGKTIKFKRVLRSLFESDVIPDSGKIKISSSIGQGRFCLVYCF